ncbi:MAG: hypothetical protein IJZ51_02650 [Ruminiclostridium sp.]|nr:hypothetical protein [Ruminiclostridium sp.]
MTAEERKVADFLNLSQPSEYDFSSYSASDRYKVLKGLERFMVYKASAGDFNEVYENASKKFVKLKAEGYFKGLCDPDSGCALLQIIYRLLWDEKHLKYCLSDKGCIKADTLNSPATTLNKLVVKSKSGESERFKSQIESRQEMSVNYIIDRYYDESDDSFKKWLSDNVFLIEYLDSYHTLGNFMPYPVGCNQIRGNGETKDYFDLALAIIYNCYKTLAKNDMRHEAMIIATRLSGSEGTHVREENFMGWLESFGNWNTFVEKNFLSPFVEKENNNGNYGRPKELWYGHFSGKVLPEEKEECNEYFKNATACIKERSKLMLERLKQI